MSENAHGGPSATVDVAGVRFAVTSFDDAVKTVLDLATGSGSPVGTPVRLSNAYCVSLARTEPAYAALLGRPGITFPDGAPVAWVMRSSGSPAAERVRGPSLFVAALDRGRRSAARHYFLGSTPETLNALVREAELRYPGVIIAGMYAPPFGPVDDALIDDAAARIATAAPNLVWVGMGTPKQDFAASALAERIGLPTVAVGAAFDFLAGTTREAPLWVQRSGFEWLFRLVSEPRRLWRRYLVGNTRFIVAVARSKLARADNG